MNTIIPFLLVISLTGCSTPEPITTQVKVSTPTVPSNLLNRPVDPVPFKGKTLREFLDYSKDNNYLWATQREQMRLLIDYVETINNK